MSSNFTLNKNVIDQYLFALAKEYKKLSNRTPIQLIIVGGSSILINYNFRESTIDIDAFYGISDAMKQAIYRVSDSLNLPNGWLNDDFKKTDSFTYKIIQYSTYYKTFANVMEVRTIKGEYLIAMKLMSLRKINNDLSDVIGIIVSERKNGNYISLEKVEKAFIDLYSDIKLMSNEARNYLIKILDNPDLESTYSNIRNKEINDRKTIMKINKITPIKSREQIEDIIKNKK